MTEGIAPREPTPDASLARVLAVDVSNAFTSLALWQGAQALHGWRVRSDPERTTDELELLLVDLLRADGVDPASIDGVVMACVVPELQALYETVCTNILSRPPLTVGPGVRTGVAVKATEPSQVGPDRIANAVAAVARFGSPSIVLDCATTLTFDIIDAEGAYAGAIIAPGMDTAADALARGTAGLPRIDLALPASAIAASTIEGIASGLVYGYLGMVEGLVADLHATLGPAPVVATGESSWASLLVDSSPAINAYEPLLTLDGLRRIYLLSTIERTVGVPR